MSNKIYEPNTNYHQRPIEYEVHGDCWINISHTKDKDGYGIVMRQ
jgi:hypothetical protein